MTTAPAQASGEGVTGNRSAVLAALWPTPWRIDNKWPSQSRARIVDADGNQVINGMNHAKAEFIVGAVNRDAATPNMLVALETARMHAPLIKLAPERRHVIAQLDAAIAIAKAEGHGSPDTTSQSDGR